MKVVRYILYIIIAVFFLWVAGLFASVFICDSFIVRGESMEPTLHDGQRIYVNKLIMGARIYTSFDFASTRLDCFRIPGFRKARVGDIVVINDPYFRCRDSITFTINQVNIKRCYGCPGDTVLIRQGYYLNTSTDEPYGPMFYQTKLAEMGDSTLRSKGVYVDAWNVNKLNNWTITDLGPVSVPEKGCIVLLTKENYRSYKNLIHYETGKWPYIRGNDVFIDDAILKEYEFSSDWYFLGGDNVLNSRDSRYFGFMPEEFIVGIVSE